MSLLIAPAPLPTIGGPQLRPAAGHQPRSAETRPRSAEISRDRPRLGRPPPAAEDTPLYKLMMLEQDLATGRDGAIGGAIKQARSRRISADLGGSRRISEDLGGSRRISRRVCQQAETLSRIVGTLVDPLSAPPPSARSTTRASTDSAPFPRARDRPEIARRSPGDRPSLGARGVLLCVRARGRVDRRHGGGGGGGGGAEGRGGGGARAAAVGVSSVSSHLPVGVSTGRGGARATAAAVARVARAAAQRQRPPPHHPRVGPRQRAARGGVSRGVSSCLASRAR